MVANVCINTARTKDKLKYNIMRKITKYRVKLFAIYFVISRYLIRWLIFKPLYRLDALLTCGRLKKPHWNTPSRFKWLSTLNYKIAKLSALYGI